MTDFSYSILFSAGAAGTSGNIGLGYALTDSPGGGMVVATAANLAASPSGRVLAIPRAVASSGLGIPIQQAGVVPASLLPFVGAGANGEFAVANALGQVVRSALPTGAFGSCGADGSVVLALAGGLISGNASTATCVSTCAIGDVLCSANDVDATKLTKATDAALSEVGAASIAIALTAVVSAPATVTFANAGDKVAAATVGLGAGAAAYGVVSTFRVVRKTNPDVGDYVVGSVDEQGNPTVAPERYTGPFNTKTFGAENDGGADASDAIMAAVVAARTAFVTGDGDVVRRLDFPPGRYNLTKPIYISDSNVMCSGDQRNGTYLVAYYAGPVFYAGRNHSLTVNAADYGGLNSVELGDDPAAFTNRLILSRYGRSWDELHGMSAFCIDMIVRITDSQAQTRAILSSSGFDPAGDLTNAFRISASAADFGFSSTNLGLTVALTTTSGAFAVSTDAGAISTGATWYRVRVDYDGSNVRIYVNNTLVKTAACTGSIIQKHWESVTLGWGLSGGVDSTVVFEGVPDGLSLASLRMSFVSRLATGFVADGTKFAEDADTKFLLNFDVIEGALHFARTHAGGVLGMADAWIPNANDESVNLQLPNLTFENFQIAAGYGGAGYDLMACVHAVIKNVSIRAKHGVILGQNSYFSTIDDAFLSCTGGRGTGIYGGGATNYTAIRNVQVQLFARNLNHLGQFCLEGFGYWLTPQFVNLYVNNCFYFHISGNHLISDEAADVVGYAPEHAIVLDACGTGKISGCTIGHNTLTTSRQLTVYGRHRPISADTKMHISVDSVTFSHGALAANSILVDQCLDGDQVIVTNVDDLYPMFSVTGGSLAKIIVPEREIGAEHAVNYATDANKTVDINDWTYGHIVVTDTGPVLTTGRQLIIPAIVGYGRWIRNATAQTITVIRSGGTSVAIAAGKTAYVLVVTGGAQRMTADV